MITNLFIAYLVFTNTIARNYSETERFDTLYKTTVYSFVLEGETVSATNRTEIGRRWMHVETNLVDVGNGLFRKETNWVEFPGPRRTADVSPPPMPPPPPLPGGVSTNVPSAILPLNTYTGPRVP